MKSVYVGNLTYSTTEDELKQLFSPFGDVHGVKLIIDHETNRPKGFGFVQMNDDGAVSAIQALDGQQFGGRRLRANEAREKRHTTGNNAYASAVSMDKNRVNTVQTEVGSPVAG